MFWPGRLGGVCRWRVFVFGAGGWFFVRVLRRCKVAETAQQDRQQRDSEKSMRSSTLVHSLKPTTTAPKLKRRVGQESRAEFSTPEFLPHEACPLPMNRSGRSADSLSARTRRVALETRGQAVRAPDGSWSQCGSTCWRSRLPMNRKMRSLISNCLRILRSWAVSRSERNTELSMNRAPCHEPVGRSAEHCSARCGLNVRVEQCSALPVHGPNARPIVGG